MDRHKICRYFERGSCKKQKCPFVHLRESRKNCQFYLQGYCKKGTNCNFYHPPKQSEQEKDHRKNYKPSFQKKSGNKWKEGNLQQVNQWDVEENGGKEEKVQQKKQYEENKEIQQKIDKQQKVQKETEKRVQEFKSKQIDFLLGLGQESSDEQVDEMDKKSQNQKQEKPIRRKPLNLTKLYPKKFPDYTKSPQSKKKILQNQSLYFKGMKYMQLIQHIDSKIERQFYQIIRKYQDSFTSLQPNNDLSLSIIPKYFLINLRPLLYEGQINLHFQMIEDFFLIKIDAKLYPQSLAHFYIQNISIPQQYKAKFVGFFNKLHHNHNIYQTLKIFCNKFQKIYQLIKFKLQNEYYSEIQLQQKIQRKLNEELQLRQKKKNENRKRRQKLQKLKEQKKQQNPDVQIIKYGSNQKIVIGNMSYQIKLQSLFIANAEYVLAQRLLLFIECVCQKKLVHILEADRKEMKIGVRLKCKKCQVVIGIAFQREVMQLKAQVVGKFGMENGKLVEVGGISWKIGCACNGEIVKSRICMPGYRLNVNCIQCFKSMQVSYMGLKFHNPFFKQSQLIQDGKELPNKGACKHMKLNFRWIRYGCCGRTFCCDECHIAGSVYPHKIIQGSTMLCGYCSIEQVVNNICSYCKKQLIKGVDKTGHWEGGLGCRDKEMLSKKDAKKYTGLTKQQQQQQQQHK